MRRLISRFTRPRRDDGATAVMVALLALVLIGVGALAVDIGQVLAKRAALQSNVDHAVMAATAAYGTNPNVCTAEMLTIAEDYLTKATNQVPDQVAVNLTDGDDSTGRMTCVDWRVDLWAPVSNVSWGMARAVTGSEGVDVPAHAAAQVKSPASSGVLPLYAVANGCDMGNQTIAEPPPGQGGSGGNTTPDLSPDSQQHHNSEFTIDPTEVASGTAGPIQMLLSSDGNNSDLSDVSAVGFTEAGGDHHEVPPLSADVGQVQVLVPQAVLDNDGVWWVRVLKPGQGNNPPRWSKPNDAQPFVVGDLLFCGGVVNGNFGGLEIARNDPATPSTFLERNIILGPQEPLAIWPGPEQTCHEGSPYTVSVHPAGPKPGTNCLGTQTGFLGQDATNGFITGSGTLKGRLDAPTTDGCSRSDDSSRTVNTPPGIPLNDDQLSCFLIGGATIEQVKQGAAGVLSADILQSPRFFRIPVIPVEATQGSSGMYPIADFRTGFITMEGSGQSMNDFNGIFFDNKPGQGHKIKELRVILFPDSALPETAPAVGGEIVFTGSGTKVIVLVQ